jgi:ABC-type lipoprotein release transport system permease subunit
VLAFRSYRGGPVLFNVKAVLPERADLVAGDIMVVSEPDFRALFALPAGVVNDIAVHLAPGPDLTSVQRKVSEAVPGARVITRRELLATAQSFLGWRHGLPAVFLLAMALALLIVAADKPSALSVDEQKEIGTLRALGWSKADVLVAKAWESLAVSIVALLVGSLTAYVHIYLGEAALFAPLLKGWAVLAPTLDLTPSFDVPFLSVAAASTLILPAFGNLFATYRPASRDPDAVIRD